MLFIQGTTACSVNGLVENHIGYHKQVYYFQNMKTTDYIICSIIFDITGSREIGLNVFGNVSSPFLNIGTTFAIFILSGFL